MNLVKRLFSRNDAKHHAHALYGIVVARARDGALYRDKVSKDDPVTEPSERASGPVPDTFDGRFEMLVLHLYVLHGRLKDGSVLAREVSQLVFDALIDDVDASLREAGVGDQTVPKRIKKMTRVFYGRVGAYEQAFADDERLGTVQQVLARNLYPDGQAPVELSSLALYMIEQAEDAARSTENDIIHEHQIFPHKFSDYV